MFAKKNLVLVTALLLATASVAWAEELDDTTFNLGGEISFFNKPSYNSANTHDLNGFKASDSDTKLVISKNKPGFNIFVGARFNQYCGGEIGFGFIDKANGTAQDNNEATNKISNVYLDFFGFMPVATQVDLIGAVGIGELMSHANVANFTFDNKESLTKSKVGFRVGGGAQYNITPNCATRAMIRYQQGSKAFLRNLISISVGGLYTF